MPNMAHEALTKHSLLPDVSLWDLTLDRDLRAAPQLWKGLSSCRWSPVTETPKHSKKGRKEDLENFQAVSLPSVPLEVLEWLIQEAFCLVLDSVLHRWPHSLSPTFYGMCTKWDIHPQFPIHREMQFNVPGM